MIVVAVQWLWWRGYCCSIVTVAAVEVGTKVAEESEVAILAIDAAAVVVVVVVAGAASVGGSDARAGQGRQCEHE